MTKLLPLICAFLFLSCGRRDREDSAAMHENPSRGGALTSTDMKTDQNANPNTTSVTAKKEWLGESGYCNCLLVSMARMQTPSVEITLTQALPNLEDLTIGRTDTHKWIKAQALEYDQLDRLTIIRMLAESGGISLGNGTSGTIAVQDVVGDDGPVVQRIFELKLSFTRDNPNLSVVQRGVVGAKGGVGADTPVRASSR